jgi:hypothetical protein
MIVKQGLVVITEVQRVTGYLDCFGQVTKSKIQHIDLVVPRLVVEHNIKFLALIIYFVFALLLLD